MIKDYTTEKKRQIKNKINSFLYNQYIAGYKIVDDKIIIKKGLFKNVEVDYSKKNVKLLNEQLKKQYEKMDPKIFSLKNDQSELNMYSFAFGAIALIILNTVLLKSIPFLSLCATLGTIYCAGGIVVNGIRSINTGLRLKRYTKYSFVKNNKEALDKEITNEKDINKVKSKLKNVDPITKNVILREKRKDRDIFDVNTINSMSLDSLKQLRANLETIRNQEVSNDGPKLTLDRK